MRERVLGMTARVLEISRRQHGLKGAQLMRDLPGKLLPGTERELRERELRERERGGGERGLLVFVCSIQEATYTA